jgi:hypothetical protein
MIVGVEWLQGAAQSGASTGGDAAMPPAHELSLLVLDPSTYTSTMRDVLRQGGPPWHQKLRLSLGKLSTKPQYQVRGAGWTSVLTRAAEIAQARSDRVLGCYQLLQGKLSLWREQATAVHGLSVEGPGRCSLSVAWMREGTDKGCWVVQLLYVDVARGVLPVGQRGATKLITSIENYDT